MISWNRGAERIFGYTEAEVLGKPLSMLMPERFRPMHDAGIKRVVDGGVAASRLIGKTVEVVGLRKDGREFPLELSLATWDTGRAAASSAASSATSPSARRPRTRSRRVLETAPDPIVEIDPDGTHRARQRPHRQAVRLRARADHRPPGREAVRRAHARAGRRALRRRAAEQGRDSQVALGMGLELWGQRKDGTRVPGRRHAQPAADRRRHRADHASSATSPSASASRPSSSTWPTTTR